jgi:hypothetical protein
MHVMEGKARRPNTAIFTRKVVGLGVNQLCLYIPQTIFTLKRMHMYGPIVHRFA